MPNIRVDLTFDKFELVKFQNGFTSIKHFDRFAQLELLGIKEAKSISAVAENQPLTVSGQAPAFAGVLKLTQLAERVGVVNKPNAMLPGQLVQLAIEQCQAFGKIRRRNFNLSENLSCLQIDPPQCGLTNPPGAFNEIAAGEE